MERSIFWHLCLLEHNSCVSARPLQDADREIPSALKDVLFVALIAEADDKYQYECPERQELHEHTDTLLKCKQ